MISESESKIKLCLRRESSVAHELRLSFGREAFLSHQFLLVSTLQDIMINSVTQTMFHVKHPSLANTETAEYLRENLVVSDLAENLLQMSDHLPEVKCEHFEPFVTL